MNPVDRRMVAMYAPLTGNLQSRWRLTLWSLIALIGVLAGLVVIGVSVYDDAVLHSRGVVTMGEVTKVGPRGSKSKSRTVSVRVPELPGREITFQVTGASPAVGELFGVRYDPQHPARAKSASDGFGKRLYYLVLLPLPLYWAWRDMTLHRRLGAEVEKAYREPEGGEKESRFKFSFWYTP